MHEPLVIVLVLPYANTPLMEHCKKELKSLLNENKDVDVLLKTILNMSADLKKMSAKDTEIILSQPQ